MKAPPPKEAHNESEGHPSSARAKEAGRRYRNNPAPSHWLSRERAGDRETVRSTEKEMEVEKELPSLLLSSTVPAVNSCSSNGESDVEALLAKLRAFRAMCCWEISWEITLVKTFVPTESKAETNSGDAARGLGQRRVVVAPSVALVTLELAAYAVFAFNMCFIVELQYRASCGRT
ncbi:hypothetical protein NQZ68_026613 [Dissostichus eleginoides]|nr:hypothetical protein NQZ68_026613 [Dissostichus eleginoides]